VWHSVRCNISCIHNVWRSVRCNILVVFTMCSVSRSVDVANGERDSDDEESTSGDESSDLWTLLRFIMNYRTNLGLRLAEPFLRLPSKRFVCSFNKYSSFSHLSKAQLYLISILFA